ncbi:MAG: epoxide hydrolase [Rhodospirillaceae bacterium]|nr:MAG: epoxide hydrolase [Rhodospirillaceae bacterium]
MADAARIEPFHLNIPQTALDDLKLRLDMTRWPERETVSDWSQGAPLAKVRGLCDYWRGTYDWRRCENMLNGFGQFRTEIDGLGIHFLHIPSPEAKALPLLMTHGWPGSIIEFHKVIGPLTNPVAHGGNAGDAFHLVLPTLPGYGFSDKPTTIGWNSAKIAKAWLTLMQRLGYTRFVAQGGDWGSAMTTALAALQPKELAAIHLNLIFAQPDKADMENPTPEEAEALAAMKYYQDKEGAYAFQQRTRPQTLGYGLADSPAGQAAWIYEKLCTWSDCSGDPENVLTLDEMLDNIMLYWLPNAGTSSARLYWESFNRSGLQTGPIEVPTGCSIFPKEINKTSRRWAERTFKNIVHWNRLDRGGHFAAFEQPQLFVEELRTCFRQFR